MVKKGWFIKVTALPPVKMFQVFMAYDVAVRCTLLTLAFLLSCPMALAGDLGSVVESQRALSSKDAAKKAKEDEAASLTQEADKIAEYFTYEFYLQAKQAGVSFLPMDGVGAKKTDSSGLMVSETIQALTNKEFVIVRRCLWSNCRDSGVVNIAHLNEQGVDVYFAKTDGTDCDPVALSCICNLSALGAVYSVPCKQLFDQDGRIGLRKKVVSWMNHNLVLAIKAAQAEN